MIAVGVASPSAHGHAMTITEMNTVREKTNCGWVTPNRP
jgi:hypothetical protein